MLRDSVQFTVSCLRQKCGQRDSYEHDFITRIERRSDTMTGVTSQPPPARHLAGAAADFVHPSTARCQVRRAEGRPWTLSRRTAVSAGTAEAWTRCGRTVTVWGRSAASGGGRRSSATRASAGCRPWASAARDAGTGRSRRWWPASTSRPWWRSCTGRGRDTRWRGTAGSPPDRSRATPATGRRPRLRRQCAAGEEREVTIWSASTASELSTPSALAYTPKACHYIISFRITNIAMTLR